MKDTTKIVMKYSFGTILIIMGIFLELFGLGNKAFLGFESISDYLIYVGFISIIIVTISSFFKKKTIVDERMISVSDKANRIVFLSIILIGFTMMIIDGIKPITLPYSLSMSYLVCATMFIRVISYRILLKLN